jgi:hypothetical protein
MDRSNKLLAFPTAPRCNRHYLNPRTSWVHQSQDKELPNEIQIVAIAAGVLLAAGSASAITVDGVVDAGYGAAVSSDAILPTVGEGGAGANGPMDLQDLYAITDSGTLYVALTINSDIAANNWGKYVVYIDTDTAIAGSSTGDQWGRAISSTGSDYQFHCWVDSGGGSGFQRLG